MTTLESSMTLRITTSSNDFGFLNELELEEEGNLYLGKRRKDIKLQNMIIRDEVQ